ncbi:MAG: VCBS repeat-containing protein, partial [Magnetococcales bacterium]|nr:VCBS repeat-containing protein [Magnetococcales bacterium]
MHIFSHGSPGQLSLGSGTLSLSTLSAYTPQLQSWGNALTADADILFYGCNVAADGTGLAFINALSQTTGADVAASNDLTGAARLGGDWQLEVKSGVVTAPSLTPDYDGVLPNLSFTTATNYPVGSSPQSVTTADFNGDGRLDLAAANYESHNLSVLLGNGAGGLNTATNYPVGSNPISVTSGDFNGDGRLDLAAANYESHNLSVLLGNGAGGLNTATNYPVGSNPISVTSGDFNGDGRLDLAAANYESHNLSVLLGNGTGGFSNATYYPVGSGPHSVISGDFNGDGRLDLAAANQRGADLSVLLGNGSGGFSTATNYPVGGYPRSVTSADFNGDGRIDLATANYGNLNLSVLLGNGSGGFYVVTYCPVNALPFSVTTADFNGDGKIDLAADNLGDRELPVLLGNGSGGFSNATYYSVGSGPYSSPYSVTSGDFNGDGRPDLAAANAGSDTLSVLLNTSGDSAVTPTSLELLAGDDSRASGDGVTNKTSVTITGSAEPGAKVTLFDGSSSKGTTTVTATGEWSVKLTNLSQGNHNFTAKQVVDGKTSDASPTLLVSIDTSVPAAVTSMKYADNLISGKGEVGANITLFNDANNNGKADEGEVVGESIIVDETGNWSSSVT